MYGSYGCWLAIIAVADVGARWADATYVGGGYSVRQVLVLSVWLFGGRRCWLKEDGGWAGLRFGVVTAFG